MLQQIPPNSFNSPPVQGIIGFAGEDNAVNPTYAPTVFSQIVGDNPSVQNLVRGLRWPRPPAHVGASVTLCVVVLVLEPVWVHKPVPCVQLQCVAYLPVLVVL